MTDDIFERDLRIVLRDLAPADAPASLREAVAAVPRTHAIPHGAARPANTQRFLAVAGIAAIVVVGIVGLALALGGQFRGNVAAPSPSPSAVSGWVKLTYGAANTVANPSARPGVDPADVAAQRLRAARIPFAIQKLSLQFTVIVPLSRQSQAEQLIGTTGQLDFVPLGTTPAEVGAVIDLAAQPPLFGGSSVSSASIGEDQTGQRTVDFTLASPARETFAAYTESHIGEYFAVALDGKVLTAPVIQSAIPNGQVQIQSGGVGGMPLDEAQRLVDILQSGALPWPVTRVSAEPTTQPADLWTPAPATPAPSTVPSPMPSNTPDTSPAPSPTPVASATATSMTLSKLNGLPAGIQQVVHWSGGYLAVDMGDDLTTWTLWKSADARTWQRSKATEQLVGGLDGAVSVRAAPCGSGVLLLAARQDGSTQIVLTSDLTSGDRSDFTAPAGSVNGIIGVSADANAAIAWTESGQILTARDCSSWSPAAVGASAGATVTGAGILNGRYVAVGWTGAEGNETAAAWWSDDGQAWQSASVADAAGNGFITAPVFGSRGAMSVVAQPGATGGMSTFYGTTDGTSWEPAGSPLGKISGEAGSGSDSGLLSGDGTRILVYGTRGSAPSEPYEYWLGDGSGTWTPLGLRGSKADLAAINAGGLAMVLPGGILLSGDGGSYLALDPGLSQTTP